MNKLLLYIIPFLFLIIACEQDSTTSTKEVESTSPIPQTTTDSSQLIDILIFKKEKKIELWERKENNRAVFIEKGHYSSDFKLPFGHFQSKSGKMELNLPGDYYQSKIKRYPSTYFQEFDLSKRAISIKELMNESNSTEFNQQLERYQLNKVLVLPNDLRKDNRFTPCVACPHWMAEVYSDLEIRLENYK